MLVSSDVAAIVADRVEQDGLRHFIQAAHQTGRDPVRERAGLIAVGPAIQGSLLDVFETIVGCEGPRIDAVESLFDRSRDDCRR